MSRWIRGLGILANLNMGQTGGILARLLPTLVTEAEEVVVEY